MRVTMWRRRGRQLSNEQRLALRFTHPPFALTAPSFTFTLLYLVRTVSHPHRAHPNPLSKAFAATPAYIDELKSPTLGASHAATLDEVKIAFERMRLFITNELSQHHSEADSACASHCLNLGFGAPRKQSKVSLASPCAGHEHNDRRAAPARRPKYRQPKAKGKAGQPAKKVRKLDLIQFIHI